MRTKGSTLDAIVVGFGLAVVGATPGLAQAPPLGTAASFGVLAGSTVTNTGSSIINGSVGVWPGNAVVGFPPGIVTPPGTIHLADAVAQQAQLDNTNAFNILVTRPVTFDLTGQNLGNRVLTAGVYGFNTSATLTGTLILDGQGNPNSVFIIKIASTLTTASSSQILLINGAQGANVFFQVGSSATLGTNSAFAGGILALTSITLNTGATINCGNALARNGAVTLDSNTITICSTAFVAPTVPGQSAIADLLAAFIAAGGVLPPEFLSLFAFLTPSELAAALAQLSGENGTGAAQAGTQAMNSFLSLVTNPFDNNRPFAESRPDTPYVVKTLGYAPDGTPSPVARRVPAPFAGGPDARRWGIWGAGYGSQGNASGNILLAGTHDRTARTFGYASGLDYLVTPYTIVGGALSAGGTNYGLSDGLGGGRSDMFQTAIYSSTRYQAAYLSGAVAYAWHRVSTDRTIALIGTDHLTAGFSANNVGGRIEGGYRFPVQVPFVFDARYGITPYAAGQVQSFRTPSYSESAASGSSLFALSYDGRTTTTVRTELGAWFDWSTQYYENSVVRFRSRAAWAHDSWSDPSIAARFQSIPGSYFTVTGAAPASDLLLASAGAEIFFSNRISATVMFNGEFAQQVQQYGGIARLRYIW